VKVTSQISISELGMEWCDADGKQVQHTQIIDELRIYASMGGKIFVGADSMYRNDKCVFACTIAMHDAKQKIAKYYFRKERDYSTLYSKLSEKINKEVDLALTAALEIRDNIPNADIEVHVDIGKKKKNSTRFLVNQIRGWVTGLGFVCCIKPDSWASSDIADWHTK
jgi:predicted RNase H-related nuclease YkuK (DUF458 family)